MEYKVRQLTDRLRALFGAFPIVVIQGGRQVGKTTWLRHVFPDYDFVTFDPVVDIENARQDPELFLQNHQRPLILDEIQYAPEIIPVLKRLVDQDRSPGQFVLTGSQQWEVMKHISESLAGRVVFVDLWPFSSREIDGLGEGEGLGLLSWLQDPEGYIAKPPVSSERASSFSLYEQLWRGFYPEAQSLALELVPSLQESYLRTYVERDVRQFSDIADLQTFRRFLQLVAALSAQEINVSQLGREIGLSPTTAQKWLRILSATFLWYEIPPFSGNVIKRVSKKSKGYLVDTGLLCSLQSLSSPQVVGGHPLWGALFETMVVMQIIKSLGSLSPKPTLYHWRSGAGAEVDLLLEYDGRYYPFEIKGSTRPKRRDTTGITAFRKTYPHLPVAPGVVLAPCEKLQPLSEKDICLPWHWL